MAVDVVVGAVVSDWTMPEHYIHSDLDGSAYKSLFQWYGELRQLRTLLTTREDFHSLTWKKQIVLIMVFVDILIIAFQPSSYLSVCMLGEVVILS